MFKLNYPIETPEAIKLWGSEHVCNRMKAIIAFSLNLENANDNLRRFGYKLQWRKRALAAFGQYVSTPDAIGIPFSEMSDFYWNEMPVLQFPLDGFELPMFMDVLKYSWKDGEGGSVVGGKSLYMPTPEVVMSYVEENSIDLPENPNAKWDKYTAHTQMMRDRAQMEKDDLKAKAEAHKLAREAKFETDRKAKLEKKRIEEEARLAKEAEQRIKSEEKRQRKDKKDAWINKWHWEFIYWERSKDRTTPCEHGYDRWSLKPCNPTSHWFDGEHNIKPQFEYLAYKCGWQPNGSIPEYDEEWAVELAEKASAKKKWEATEARKAEQAKLAEEAQKAREEADELRKAQERKERKAKAEADRVKKEQAKEEALLGKLEKDKNTPNHSALSCPAMRV